MNGHRVQHVEDLHFNAAAADEILTLAITAVSARGEFLCALAGGETPRPVYELLATEPRASAFPWRDTTLLLGDERCVPPDDERSNFGMVRHALLDRLAAERRPTLLRMEAERKDREQAARDYEQALRGLTDGKGTPVLDLVVLGLGTDGHTASLFPGTPLLDDEGDALVAAARDKRTRTWRLTVTPRLVRAARDRLFLVRGEEKQSVLERVLDPTCDLPAARLGWATWVVAP